MGKFSALEQAVLTSKWTLEERSALGHFLEPLELKKSQEVTDLKNGLVFVGSGSINVAFQTEVLKLKSGSSFRELSLFSSEQKKVRLVANDDTTLWILTNEKWDELRQISPVVSIKLLEGITKKLTDELHRIQAQDPQLTRLVISLG